MEHPEAEEWLQDLTNEIEAIPMGQIRCNGCKELVPINGKFLDILVMRGINTIESCKDCRAKRQKDASSGT